MIASGVKHGDITRYPSAEKLAEDWIRGAINGSARCTRQGESFIAHDDVILRGESIHLLAARNRQLGCVFVLTPRKINGGWAVHKLLSTVMEHHGSCPVIKIGSFENWDPLNCALGTARHRMMECFREEAGLLLDEWEIMESDHRHALSRAERGWDNLTAMLPRLGGSVPPEYEERQDAIKMKLRLLGAGHDADVDPFLY